MPTLSLPKDEYSAHWFKIITKDKEKLICNANFSGGSYVVFTFKFKGVAESISMKLWDNIFDIGKHAQWTFLKLLRILLMQLKSKITQKIAHGAKLEKS